MTHHLRHSLIWDELGHEKHVWHYTIMLETHVWNYTTMCKEELSRQH